jgi:GNAT superfamily N-acetyltransferase
VANCGYLVAPDAFGRGVARAMCRHSLDQARTRKFTAMQFNFVIASNERAVRLWQSLGFAIAGTLPEAFEHPRLGVVDTLCDGPKALNGLRFHLPPRLFWYCPLRLSYQMAENLP